MDRSIFFYAVLLLFPLLTFGCVASNQTEDQPPVFRSGDTVSDDRDYNLTLANYLHRVSGVSVSKTGNGVQILIRGMNSIQSGNEPLFVLDGSPVGTSYEQVESMLDVRDIQQVRVLKGSDAAIYGVRGSNGVIVIHTKS